jgi:hypothetical protein
MSSPESDLSDISSDAEVKADEETSISGSHDGEPGPRPTKKRARTSRANPRASAASAAAAAAAATAGSATAASGNSAKPHTAPAWDSRRDATPDALDELDTDVSDDSWGSVPASPTHHAAGAAGAGAGAGGAAAASKDDDDTMQEQVSFCKWDGCTAGDLGDMDRLVQHLQDDHIGTRQKKYSCEWMDCSRKGSAHASGYALRAHMRSHTREKPFYCSLPGKSLRWVSSLERCG